MKIRGPLTAGISAVLAAAVFAAPGSAVAAATPHNRPESASTQPVSMADFQTSGGGMAEGKPAGIIPARGTMLRRPAVTPATSCAEPNCDLTYNGGPVQHSPRVYLLFWGPKWNTDATHKAVARYLIAFYRGLGLTPRDVWSATESQYGDNTGHPAFGRSLLAGTRVLATSPPKSVTLADLGTEAAYAAVKVFSISRGNLADAQVVIAAQSGTCFAPLGAGQPTFAGNCGRPPTASTVGYCAFHSYDLTSNPGVFLPWVNLPFQLDARQGCGENFVNGGSRGRFDGFSISGGHETAETVTDPQAGTGWVDLSDSTSGGEIADKCAWGGVIWGQTPPDPAGDLALPTGSFAMQSLWSNLTHRCVMSGALPMGIRFIPSQSSSIGRAVRLQVVASTSPRTSLSFRASGLPYGLSMSRTGLISGTPGVTAGSFHVHVTISYITGWRSFTFLWKVAAAPGPVKGFGARCVDDSGGRTRSGNRIDLFTCTGKTQQMIAFTAAGELRVAGGCITGTTIAFLAPCRAAASQIWTRHPNGGYTLKSNRRCLTDPGNSRNNGTGLTVAVCRDAAGQLWSLP